MTREKKAVAFGRLVLSVFSLSLLLALFQNCSLLSTPQKIGSEADVEARSTRTIASVGEALRFIQQPSSRSVLLGQNVNLNAWAEGENLTYQWQKDGQVLASAQGPVLQIRDLRLADLGSYRVEISDGQNTLVSRIAVLSTNHASRTKLVEAIACKGRFCQPSCPSSTVLVGKTPSGFADDYCSESGVCTRVPAGWAGKCRVP